MAKITRAVVKKMIVAWSFILCCLTTFLYGITRKEYVLPNNIHIGLHSMLAFTYANYFKKEVEIKELRTRHSRTFYKGNGKFRLESSIGPLHYQDENGAWQPVNMTIKDMKVTQGDYDAELLGDWYGYTIKKDDDKGGMRIRLRSIGGMVPQYKKPVIKGNVACWNDIVPGVDLLIRFHPTRVRIWRKLKDAAVPHDIEWDIEKDADCTQLSIVKNIVGFDQNKKLTRVVREQVEEKKNEGKVLTHLKDIFTKEVMERDPLTRRIELVGVPAYPVMIDADIDIHIGDNGGTNADDAGGITNNTGAITATKQTVKTFLEVGTYGDQHHAYTRFCGIVIPADATIDNATIAMTTKIAGNFPVTITIRANDTGNAPARPALKQSVVSPATVCNATVTHQFTTGNYSGLQSFDITAIVTELAASWSYANGGTMLFFYKPLPASPRFPNALFYSYESGDKIPLLSINYTVPPKPIRVTGATLRGVIIR